MGKTVYLETLGCVKNRVDSEIMLGGLINDGFRLTQEADEAEIVVINTCGFITSAVKESIDRILRLSELKERGTCEKLIVVGCLSERYREKLFEEIPEIDVLMGTDDFTRISLCIRNSLAGDGQRGYLKRRAGYSPNNYRAERVLSTASHYAYLKIAEGCSNGCSFCNIPKLRGGFRSRPEEEVEREFHQLLDLGVKEINLVSQDSSSYGVDLAGNHNLLTLIRRLLNHGREGFWLRVFYSYPNSYPMELLKLMRDDPRLVPYMDMPIQHISDSVLKAMNRRIGGGEIENMLNRALETIGDLAIRTTLITGFPTERDKDFEELVRFIEKGYFQHVGVFTYSMEENILAKKLGDRVDERIKEERKNRIMEIQQSISFKKNRASIGQIQKVLIEGVCEETDLLLRGRNMYQGADVDGVVLVNDGEGRQGCFHEVKITEAHPYDVVGGILK